jgi:hypothetical protein
MNYNQNQAQFSQNFLFFFQIQTSIYQQFTFNELLMHA